MTGFRQVPLTPDLNMTVAFHNVFSGPSGATAEDAWTAMLAAAPPAPAPAADGLRATLYALRQRAADEAKDGPSGAAMQGRALSAYEWLGDAIDAFVADVSEAGE